MRLLRTLDLLFEEFIDDRAVPPYAILSHTWSEGEVSFKDMESSIEASKQKPGFQKIAHCASKARQQRLRYIWVDTCCIDKSSSAELTEAINSMFNWYSNAEVCYAYLSDVISSHDFTMEEVNDEDVSEAPLDNSTTSAIRESRWFKRGWTLQELIAPRKVVFFDGRWKPLATRVTLSMWITAITGIPWHILTGGDFTKESIACRMSWAARRKTTRVEDMAYCLLGLFGVNMPLLYGEGMRAFRRLQEEIVKVSEDLTLFGWRSKGRSASLHRSLLAESPEEFKDAGTLKYDVRRKSDTKPHGITNKGIKIHMHLIPRLELQDEPADRHSYSEEYVAFITFRRMPLGALPTRDNGFDPTGDKGIFLRRICGQHFARVDSNSFYINFFNKIINLRPPEKIFVGGSFARPDIVEVSRLGGLYIPEQKVNPICFRFYPMDLWDAGRRIVATKDGRVPNEVTVVLVDSREDRKFKLDIFKDILPAFQNNQRCADLEVSVYSPENSIHRPLYGSLCFRAWIEFHDRRPMVYLDLR